jgi:L-ribulokinase
MDIVLGLDFGTDSARALAIRPDSETVGEGIALYSRWREWRYSDPGAHRFRQHPQDYVDAMTGAVWAALSQMTPEQRESVRAIGVDATGSTVCPVDRAGTLLSLTDDFRENPNAMFHLWKDHTAVVEADEIDRAFSGWPGGDYTRFQGKYSSEWFWSKALHTARIDPRVRDAAWSWVELADWIPALLTGRTKPESMYRCACAAGHKALWHSNFGGLPARECLASLHPHLAEIADRYAAAPGMATDRVGTLLPRWRDEWGLPDSVIVSGSSLDAHAGAVGAGIRPGTLVKVIGTSTVDMAVVAAKTVEGKPIRTVCGLAENSILPGYIGLEAGQAAFGDMFAWFRGLLMWGVRLAVTDEAARAEIQDGLLARLDADLPDDGVSMDMTALDWFNGRRYPDNDDSLRSAITGLSLGADAPGIYRALVFAAVNGSRAVVEGILGAGIELQDVIAVGGITHKSPYVMQLMADALNRTVRVSASKQTCALGAAMYAAVAAGLHPNLAAAQEQMGAGFSKTYRPDPARCALIETQYRRYLRLSAAIEALHREEGRA